MTLPWASGAFDNAAAHSVKAAAVGGAVWDQVTAGPDLTFPTAVSVVGHAVSSTSIVRTTTAHSSGKYYVEFTIDRLSFKGEFGLANSSMIMSARDLGNDANPSNSCGVWTSGPFFANANGGGLSVLSNPIPKSGNTNLDMAVNLDDTPNLLFYRVENGPWNPLLAGTQNPALPAGTGGGIDFRNLNSSLMVAGPYYVAFGTWLCDITARFASGSWINTGSKPAGYSQW